MLDVVLIVEEDALRKVDSQYPYLIDQLAHIYKGDDVVIVLICTNENIRKEGTWKKKGTTYHAIRLPYEQVKQMDDIRPIMLDVVTRKLGITLPATTAAAA